MNLTVPGNYTKSPYYQTAVNDAAAYNLDPNFFTSLIGAESGFDPNAYNATPVNTPYGNENAQGIAQFLPSTATDVAASIGQPVDPFDPDSALYASSAYLSQLLQKCGGDYVCAAQSYGTLPRDTSKGLTTKQLQVLNAAKQANTNSGLNSTWYDKVACHFGFASRCTQPTQAKQSIDAMNDFVDNLNPTTKSDCAWYDFNCSLESYGADALALVSGIILLVVGLVMLKSGGTIGDTIKQTAKFASKKVTMSGAEAAALAMT